MTTSPFWTGPAVAADGVDPRDPIYWPTDEARFWIGKPGVMMVELPSPFDYTATPAAGEVEQGLFGGGSAITRFDSATRRWTLSYRRLAGRDWQVVSALNNWQLIGPPPWCYIGPEDNNRLTLAQSLCGAKHGAVEGWLSDGGAPVYQSAIAAQTFPGGVMSWTPGATSKILAAGATGGTPGFPDVATAAPYLPGMPTSWIIWAKMSSGTGTLKARISGRLASGTIATQVDGPNVALTTAAWTPVYVVGAAGAFPASQYLVPEVVSVTTGAFLLSCPSLSYQDIPGDWEIGSGAPRVVGPIGRDRAVDVHRSSDTVLTLAETITGAL